MVKKTMILLTAVFALLMLNGEDALSMDLNQFKWKNRLLFIFTPQSSNLFFTDLHSEILAQKDGVSERDLVVFQVVEAGPSFRDTEQIDSQMSQGIRDRFDVPSGSFTVILVGKDGGVKLRQDTQVKLEDIFALIDAMPMRQEEMRQNKQ